jgi:hypothetical protein
MLVDESFADLKITPEDLAQAPPVDLDGEEIPEGLPERFERLLASNPRLRAAWESSSYPSVSEQAFALMGFAGVYGLTKTEAAAVHVALYARRGRKEDGIRKAPYALKAWAEGRARAEAWERGGNGRPMERERGEPGPDVGSSVAGDGRPEERRAEPPGAPTSFTRPLSDLLSVPDEPIPWLCGRLLVRGANGFIGGEPKSLKSWLALYLAVCLSLGVPVFGRYHAPEPARVLYLQEDDGERRVRRRVRQILAGLGLDPPKDEFFRYSIKAGVLLDDTKWVARLRAELTAYRPALVVGDVFELMHMRDSDRRSELKPVLYSLDRLREEFGCGFLLADHFKKATIGTSKRGGQRLAGTVGKHAWGECSFYLFPLRGKNRVRVETELKDAPSEAFGLALEDTPEGGVAFQWQAEAADRESEMKEKVLAALEGAAAPGEWVKTATVAEAAGTSENTARKYLDTLVDVDRNVERERRTEGRAKPWYWRLRPSGV